MHVIVLLVLLIVLLIKVVFNISRPIFKNENENENEYEYELNRKKQRKKIPLNILQIIHIHGYNIHSY